MGVGDGVEPKGVPTGLGARGNGEGGRSGHAGEGQAAGRERPSPLFHVCPFILVCEFGERLAFYGILTNLVVYLLKVGFTNTQAAILVPIFIGGCYVTPLVGGYLADTRWGRYRTILYSAMVYVLGIAILTLSAGVKGWHPEGNEKINRGQAAVLFTSLVLVAVGTGGIKPNVSSFGADHFDENNDQEMLERDSFFNWFYLAVNLGSLLASIFIVYIEVAISWALGFCITGIAMSFAIVVLVMGKPRYQHHEVKGSPFTRMAKIIAVAITNRRSRLWHHQQNAPDGDIEDSEMQLLAAHPEDDKVRRRAQFRWLYPAIGPDLYSEEQVSEVKLVLGVLPVFFTNVLYWAVYMPMSTLFVQQGTLMNLSIGKFTLPAASLSVFDVLAIMFLVPLYDRVIVPYLREKGKEPTQLQRIGAGYCVVMVTMVISAAIERERLDRFKQGEVIVGQETHSEALAVDMSIWWQVFQYLGIGASEVLSAIGQLNFFYDEAPKSMRSCMMAVQLLSGALGSWTASLLVWVVNSVTKMSGTEWIPADLNKGRLDLMYLTLAGLMLFNIAIFAWVAKRYQYRRRDAPKQAAAGHDPSSFCAAHCDTGEEESTSASDASPSGGLMGASES